MIHDEALTTQSTSPARLGVSAALHASASPEDVPRPKIFDEFSLSNRVGIVSGGNRSLGLEMALAFCEQGARAVYCLDRAHQPSVEWYAACEYVRRMGTPGGRLEYVCTDVRDQKGVWTRVKNIGDREERMDFCVASAGLSTEDSDCLEQPAEAFKAVLDVNVNGVLFTAQAAGQQMLRFGNSGSIILIASISGRITNKASLPPFRRTIMLIKSQDQPIIPYNTSKSAVLH